ncbi:flavin reductase family protein [Saprospira sp. CCB-QB6]|uniref:flavin reductase family protein n=1 Tax=Saprospira sp. CCB-QB6 TaxID=3023936 RepID=UPI00234BEFAE|nr:flavin reductase family protein [Saprospira sp. CCB-QB6]WCL80030.1 flavin reductase family protein [Saprospira sp. CCB-QB6]
MSKMRSINPQDLEIKDLHQFMVGAIAPRPIAFVSTIDENGVANIAPYSFFNAFSSNPPMMVFSSNRTVRGNTTKDTLHNIQANQEVVINVVTYDMVQQMTLASISYPAHIDEFAKAGFTPLAAETVAPFRIAESPVQFECKVEQIISLGEHGGAGNLMFCKVQRFHIDEAVIDERNRIDPHKLDLVGRLGRAYYVRASGDALFSIYQNPSDLALGFDQLPERIRQSETLSGKEIAYMAGLMALPTEQEIEQLVQTDDNLANLLELAPAGSKARFEMQERYARTLLQQGEYANALACLMIE